MPKIVWNSFNNGLSDNIISGGKGQFTDCENIDIKSNPLAVQIGEGKVRTLTMPHGMFGNAKKISSTGYNSLVILTSTGAFQQNGTQIGHINEEISQHIYIGGQLISGGNIEYSSKNYFFASGKIYKMNWDCSRLENTITHEHNAEVSSVIRVAHTILFSKNNVVYELNVITDTIKEVVNTIPYEYRIVGMSFFNDELQIVTVFHEGTKIFRLLYNSGLYDIVYSHTIRGEQAKSMTSENEQLYWITEKSIFVTSGGQSQRFKKIGGNAIGFYGNTMMVSSFGHIYMYEPIYIGGQRVLVKILNDTFKDVCKNFFLGNQELYTLAGVNGNRACIISNSFFENPSIEKEISEITIAYKMEYSKNQQIDRRMSMELWITQDEDSQAEWIKIADINDENTRTKTISAKEIKQAFDRAGKKHTFFVLKAKIVMNAGGRMGYTQVYYDTPKFYQLEIHYNNVNYARN